MSEPNPLRDRRTEEPRGRWEDRCDYAWKIAQITSGRQWLICDRPSAHKGLHRGRIWYLPIYPGDAAAEVRAYGAHR